MAGVDHHLQPVHFGDPAHAQRAQPVPARLVGGRISELVVAAVNRPSEADAAAIELAKQRQIITQRIAVLDAFERDQLASSVEAAGISGSARGFDPGGKPRNGGIRSRPIAAAANIWRGNFPSQRDGGTKSALTTAVGNFPVDASGLVDMIGNVWEWTEDCWSVSADGPTSSPCCFPRNPRGGERDASTDGSDLTIPRKVLKGGSHLCAPSHCRRYRPSARYPQPIDTTTSHVGFRCVKRDAR